MNRTRILLVVMILAVLPALVFAQSNATGNQRSLPTYQFAITANVRNAQIYVNGDLQRDVTPATLSLRRGSYEIRVESRGYLPWTDTVNVSSNMTIRAELVPPFATVLLEIPQQFLNYDVRSPMSLISLYIDGELHRESQVQVRAGRHEVVIVSGGLRFESDIFFEGGMTYTLELILRLNLLQTLNSGS
jgi:PEGA domain